MKRILDLALAGVGLVVLLPLFGLLAVAIKLGDFGPVFFRQARVGQGGQIFTMLKFRTMKVGADRGAALTVGLDQRITSVGSLLRIGKLDELPQLWNVVVGHMSLVGPRPEVAKFVNLYSPAQREVLQLKPGITDPASFAFYDESEILGRAADPEKFYREKLMGEKIRINLEYAGRASIWTDIFLMIATVARIFGLRLNIFSWLRINSPTLPH